MKKISIVALLLFFSVSPAFAGLKVNAPAPFFSLPDANQKELSLREIVGTGSKEKSSGVVLSFFASWCIQCRNELPVLNSLVDELNSKGIKVVIIGVRENFDRIESLLAELNVDKPVVLSDRQGSVTEAYQVRFLPTTFFIGSDGKVRDIIFGEIKDKAELRNSAGKLLK